MRKYNFRTKREKREKLIKILTKEKIEKVNYGKVEKVSYHTIPLFYEEDMNFNWNERLDHYQREIAYYRDTGCNPSKKNI